jgi:hypothetical protein
MTLRSLVNHLHMCTAPSVCQPRAVLFKPLVILSLVIMLGLSLSSHKSISLGVSDPVCDPLALYEMPQDAKLIRERWSNNLSFELQALLDQHSKRGASVGNEVEAYVPYELGQRRFDAIGPVAPRCHVLESYGVGDGEKRACGLLSRSIGDCVVISIGCNGQWAFEEDIVAKTNCTVYTFDCTVPEHTAPPLEIRDRVKFHPQCIAAREGVINGAHFITWPTLLSMIGLAKPPTFLKLDIEGVSHQSVVDNRTDVRRRI